MDRADRSTIIMISIVLIVSIVALIAVISISWSIVGDSVSDAVNSITRFFRLQNLDYNFEIPNPETINK